MTENEDQELEQMEELISNLHEDLPHAQALAMLDEEERRETIGNLRRDLIALRNAGDEEFVKGHLEEIIDRGQLILAIMEQEIERDPTPRAVETTASMINALASALENYMRIKFENARIAIQQSKVEQKQLGRGGTNVILVGGTTEVLKMLEGEQEDIVEVEGEVIKE